MSLRLVVEHSPSRQPVAERAVAGGEISIGRGPEADWRIEDPDQYISRKHCVIAGQGADFTVTDTSRGGLFVDGEEAPLGAGRSRPLRDGTRLRMGDVVIRVELAGRASAGAPPAPGGTFAIDDFFAAPPQAAAPPLPRPASLPEPFDALRARGDRAADVSAHAAPPPFDDPFEFGPPARAIPAQTTADPFADWSGAIADATRAEGPSAAPPAPPDRPTPDPFAGWPDSVGDAFGSRPAAEPSSGEPGSAAPPASDAAERVTVREGRGENAVLAPAAKSVPAMPPPAPAVGPDVVAALLRGMGLDPATAGHIGEAEMEALGRQVLALVEGLMRTLRSRAKEKQSLRVVQTVIGTSEVNPFKFLPDAGDALRLMLGEARPGYLAPEAAIAAAQADLADHQLRSWLGLQASLRRMVARFDPAEIERELEEAGRLRSLLAGGRNALLWRLYRDRFAEIAKAAEDRFLGEVGADFRDAYESRGRTGHD